MFHSLQGLILSLRLKNAGNIAKEGAVGASNGKGLIPSRLPCDFDTSSAGKL